MNDSLLLNYNDACIYQSDLQLVQSKTQWLNDACIHYHMKRLASRDYMYHCSKSSRGSHNNTIDATSSSSFRSAPLSLSDGASTSTTLKRKINETNSTNDDDDNNNNNNNAKPLLNDSIITNIEYLDPSIVSFFMHQLSINDQNDHDELLQLCHDWNLHRTTTVDDDDDNDDDNNNNYNTIGDYGTIGRDNNSSSSYQTTFDSNQLNLVLVPINDNHSGTYTSFQTPGGGNHWSLLVVVSMLQTQTQHQNQNQRKQQQQQKQQEKNENHNNNVPSTNLLFFHLDSSSHGMNSKSATSVATKIYRIHLLQLQTNKKKNHLSSLLSSLSSSSSSSSTNINVIECKTPQQQNGHDCGIHTLAAATAIRDWMKNIDTNKRTCSSRSSNQNQQLSSSSSSSLTSLSTSSIQNEIKSCLEDSIHDFIYNKNLFDHGSVNEMTKSMRQSIVLDMQKIASMMD